MESGQKTTFLRKIQMSEERKHLLRQLKETVEYFKNRKTVGRMKTEHSIFIPSSLMLEQSNETEAFIKAAKHINNTEEWNCPVVAAKLSGTITGVEFVFEFTPDTEFDAIMNEIETRLN